MRFCATCVEAQRDLLEVADEQLRQRLCVPVVARAHAIADRHAQYRHAVADGEQRVLRIDQVEVLAADPHVIVERARWEGLRREAIGPAYPSEALPVGRGCDLVELDALAHANLSDERIVRQFSGERRLRQRHADAIHQAIADFIRPDFRRRHELIPNVDARRGDGDGALDRMHVLRQWDVVLVHTHHHWQQRETIRRTSHPARPPEHCSDDQSGDAADNGEQRRREDHADQPFDVDQESADYEQHVGQRAQPEVVGPGASSAQLGDEHGHGTDRNRCEQRERAGHRLEKIAGAARIDRPQHQADQHAARERPPPSRLQRDPDLVGIPRLHAGMLAAGAQ